MGGWGRGAALPTHESAAALAFMITPDSTCGSCSPLLLQHTLLRATSNGSWAASPLGSSRSSATDADGRKSPYASPQRVATARRRPCLDRLLGRRGVRMDEACSGAGNMGLPTPSSSRYAVPGTKPALAHLEDAKWPREPEAAALSSASPEASGAGRRRRARRGQAGADRYVLAELKRVQELKQQFPGFSDKLISNFTDGRVASPGVEPTVNAIVAGGCRQGTRPDSPCHSLACRTPRQPRPSKWAAPSVCTTPMPSEPGRLAERIPSSARTTPGPTEPAARPWMPPSPTCGVSLPPEPSTRQRPRPRPAAAAQLAAAAVPVGPAHPAPLAAAPSPVPTSAVLPPAHPRPAWVSKQTLHRLASSGFLPQDEDGSGDAGGRAPRAGGGTSPPPSGALPDDGLDHEDDLSDAASAAAAAFDAELSAQQALALEEQQRQQRSQEHDLPQRGRRTVSMGRSFNIVMEIQRWLRQGTAPAGPERRGTRFSLTGENEAAEREEPQDPRPPDLQGLARRHNCPLFAVREAWQEFSAYAAHREPGITYEEFLDLLRRRAHLPDGGSIPAHLLGTVALKDLDCHEHLSFDAFLEWSLSVGWMEELQVAPGEVEVRKIARQVAMPILDVEKIKMLFDRLDSDGSGHIEENEFRHMIYTLWCVEDVSDVPIKTLQRLWRQIDKDGSGSIDFAEFLVWYKNYLTHDAEH